VWRRCFISRIGMHAVAKLTEIIESAAQHLGAARHFDTAGGKRIAQLEQSLLLEGKSTFDVDQALFGGRAIRCFRTSVEFNVHQATSVIETDMTA